MQNAYLSPDYKPVTDETLRWEISLAFDPQGTFVFNPKQITAPQKFEERFEELVAEAGCTPTVLLHALNLAMLEPRRRLRRSTKSKKDALRLARALRKDAGRLQILLARLLPIPHDKRPLRIADAVTTDDLGRVEYAIHHYYRLPVLLRDVAKLAMYAREAALGRALKAHAKKVSLFQTDVVSHVLGPAVFFMDPRDYGHGPVADIEALPEAMRSYAVVLESWSPPQGKSLPDFRRLGLYAYFDTRDERQHSADNLAGAKRRRHAASIADLLSCADVVETSARHLERAAKEFRKQFPVAYSTLGLCLAQYERFAEPLPPWRVFWEMTPKEIKNWFGQRQHLPTVSA
jgi:hypothetical protein